MAYSLIPPSVFLVLAAWNSWVIRSAGMAYAHLTAKSRLSASFPCKLSTAATGIPWAGQFLPSFHPSVCTHFTATECPTPGFKRPSTKTSVDRRGRGCLHTGKGSTRQCLPAQPSQAICSNLHCHRCIGHSSGSSPSTVHRRSMVSNFLLLQEVEVTRDLFLAVYLAIKHFQHFVEGREFHVLTDHKPLTYALGV